MASERRCNNGHFFDPSKFISCPHCGVAGIDLGPTKPVTPVAATTPIGHTPGPGAAGGHDKTKPLNRAAAAPGEQATVGWYPGLANEKQGEKAVDPIVGWLVCVEGPDRGRDFRIKAEKNFIGRSTAMDICISGDPRVSRENHAVVAFEPRDAEFRLYAGDARGLAYLNGRMVDTPVVLQAFDAIELGNSKLLFVPFCGEQFRWPEKQ